MLSLYFLLIQLNIFIKKNFHEFDISVKFLVGGCMQNYLKLKLIEIDVDGQFY